MPVNRTVMTERERYLATLLFQHPDRVPLMPGHGRRSTRENWHRQGLPQGADYQTVINELLGLPRPDIQKLVSPGITFTMIPEFEEKVIERRPLPSIRAHEGRGTLIVQDWKGNICEISDEFSPSDLRGAPDFVTRSWIRCPVESTAEWRSMKKRYDADQPGRFPVDFSERCQKLRNRTYVAGLGWSGPFWQLREWLGFENLCMLLLDDPKFAREMINFWQEFVASMLERTFEQFVPDFILVNEDMAYKEKPMIGPEMCRDFMLPCWRRWCSLANSAGVPVREVDSDGRVDSLIPVWIEAGFNSCQPMEVAAGNDLPVLRDQFGRDMAFRGGIDKREIAKGGDAIWKEIIRVQPVIDSGGYIPGCDHGVPSNVTWPAFVEYCECLAKATGWLR